MGNKATKTTTIFTPNDDNNIYSKVADDFDEFKTDLMNQFIGEAHKGSQEKIDAICFYGDLREILIIDGNDKKKEIELLLNTYSCSYSLTNHQMFLIGKIMQKL